MINFDKVTDIFCLVDEFCNNFDNYTKNFIIGKPSKRPSVMSKSEVISTGISFVDSTPIRVCKNKRIERNKVFKDIAQVGKCYNGIFLWF